MVDVVNFTTPQSPLAPILSDTAYEAPFNVYATFEPEQGEVGCANVMYRQYIRGTFSINGINLQHYLCEGSGVVMGDVYQEDGCPPQGGDCSDCTAYGYRECDMVNDGYNDPDQLTGAKYWMYDAPGFPELEPDTTYALNLEFLGQIVDFTNPLAPIVLEAREWEVVGQVTTPEDFPTADAVDKSPPAAPQPGASPNVKPVGLRVAQSLSGKWNMILSLTQPPRSGPFDARAVKIEAFDHHGGRLALPAPTVHRVGDRRNTTAHLFYPLTPGRLPDRVIAHVGGRLHDLPVHKG